LLVQVLGFSIGPIAAEFQVRLTKLHPSLLLWIPTLLQVEQFWAFYNHLARPSELPNNDFHLFRKGVYLIVNVQFGSETYRPQLH
jgi:hypothetical protein